MLIIYFCIFFLGASLASFVNATIYRLESKNRKSKGKTFPVFEKRSHCEYCGKELTWVELLPVVGFILCSGKCKKCGKRINIYYPISEFILGISTLLFYIYDVPLYFIVTLIFLFALSYYDYLERSIPSRLTHIFLVISLTFFFLFNLNIQNIIVVGAIVLFLLILSFVMKKSFGLGDILVLGGIGLQMDYKNFLVMFWVSVLGALFVSILYGAFTKKDLRKIKIPMIPFFMISFTISCVFGEYIFDFVINDFLPLLIWK
ncbi:MAG TPA: prepilin peptidase [Candidatus Dojkabacteria bacterium]|nr:prepilin peptidase [Candidatus Dojkabacteria bacterium]